MSTSRSKRNAKPYKDYHSSDYGIEEEEDYGQDYDEDEDDFGQDDDSHRPSRRTPGKRGADDGGRPCGKDSDDSDYEGGRRRKRRAKGEGDQHQEDDDNEDTYEDEDPFSPDIDLILADK
jgi:ribonuclease E